VINLQLLTVQFILFVFLTSGPQEPNCLYLTNFYKAYSKFLQPVAPAFTFPILGLLKTKLNKGCRCHLIYAGLLPTRQEVDQARTQFRHSFLVCVHTSTEVLFQEKQLRTSFT